MYKSVPNSMERIEGYLKTVTVGFVPEVLFKAFGIGLRIIFSLCTEDN